MDDKSTANLRILEEDSLFTGFSNYPYPYGNQVFATHYFTDDYVELGYVLHDMDSAILLDTPRLWGKEIFDKLRGE